MTIEVRWVFQVLSAKFRMAVKMAKVHLITLTENPAVLVQNPSSIQLIIKKTRETIRRWAPGMLIADTDNVCDSINSTKLRSSHIL